MAQLKELRVDSVSFVRKAAVRDPADPTKPRRLLLWKSQEAHSRMAGLQEALDKAEQEKADAVAARKVAEKAQQDAEAKLAKRGHNNNESETTMTTLTGDRSETELDVPQQNVLADVIGMLEPYEDHPTLGGLLESARGATGESELETIEKSLTDMTALHVELQKSDVHNPLRAERVATVKRDLELAYLQRTSGAYQGEHGEMLHTIQKRECGIGWKDQL